MYSVQTSTGIIIAMSSDREFVRALSEFLAFQTEHSSAYFADLIGRFLSGVQMRPNLDPSARDKLTPRLKAEMRPYNDVPTFLQAYLLTHLAHGGWPSQAAFVATRYLARSNERLLTWRQRQQLVAPLGDEPIRGTELGLRQMLYSQGAGPVYHWRGTPCFKASYDIAIYSMLLNELRPGTIIELGAGAGGSAVMFADMCAAMGQQTDVLSIDKAAAVVSDPRVTFIQADCSDWLAATAKSKGVLRRPCLMIEDFHGDLAGFFGLIDAILEPGDYLVVEDSLPKQSRIAEVIKDRPYLIDTKYTDFFGINCTSAINSIFVKSDPAKATS
jgi:cephalosporin hydroxylase